MAKKLTEDLLKGNAWVFSVRYGVTCPLHLATRSHNFSEQPQWNVESRVQIAIDGGGI